MIPHERRVVTTAQYRAETGLSITEINRLIKERGVHHYGTHAKARLYDYEQLQAARAGAPELPEIAQEHELDKLTVADIATLAGQPSNTWTVYHTRQEGPMAGRTPDWVEPKKDAVKADGTARDPVEYWYRKTAAAIVEGRNPIGWVKGRPRPTSKGRPPAPELEDVVDLLRATPAMTGKEIAERLGLNERKALRLRKQAQDRLEAEGLARQTSSKPSHKVQDTLASDTDAAAALLASEPGLSGKEIAERLGCEEARGRYLRTQALAKLRRAGLA